MIDCVRVRLRVAGHVAEYFPEGRREFDLTPPAGSTVASLLDGLGVPSAVVMGATVDGVRRPLSHVVADGDTVVVLAPPAGG